MSQIYKQLCHFCRSKTGLFVIFVSLAAVASQPLLDSSLILSIEIGLLVFFSLYKFEKEISVIKAGIQSNAVRQFQSIAENHDAMLLSVRYPQLYMPVSDYSMNPNNLMLLESTFLNKKPKLIVELGSGFSTQLLSALVKNEKQGRIVSFDHDFDWVQLTKAYLERNGLSGFAEVHHVPLIKHDHDSAEWYDYKPLLEKIRGIDLLVVDGPPAVLNSKIREGALTYLYEFLNDDAVIFIDDADREGERQVVKNWSEKYPQIKAHRFSTLTGACVIHVQKMKH